MSPEANGCLAPILRGPFPRPPVPLLTPPRGTCRLVERVYLATKPPEPEGAPAPAEGACAEGVFARHPAPAPLLPMPTPPTRTAGEKKRPAVKHPLSRNMLRVFLAERTESKEAEGPGGAKGQVWHVKDAEIRARLALPEEVPAEVLERIVKPAKVRGCLPARRAACLLQH